MPIPKANVKVYRVLGDGKSTTFCFEYQEGDCVSKVSAGTLVGLVSQITSGSGLPAMFAQGIVPDWRIS